MKSNDLIYHTSFPIKDNDLSIDHFTTNTDSANTIIMSNIIAGVMYGYLINKKYPDIKYDGDYLYISILGRLLEKSGLEKQLINKDFELDDIDASIHEPSYMKQLLNLGQSGPYKLKDYAKRLPQKDTIGALGLRNYDAIAKVLGYSIEDQDNGKQSNSKVPETLENIYASPMITAFYNFNKLNEIQILSSEKGQKENGQYKYNKQWNRCLGKMRKSEVPNTFFPTIMNIIIDSGAKSSVLEPYLNICNNHKFLARSAYNAMNDLTLGSYEYQKAIGVKKIDNNNTDYYEYSRQMSFYMSQILNVSVNMGKNLYLVDNFIIFDLDRLKQVFSMSMSKLSYKDNKDVLQYISQDEANKAFDQAKKLLGLATTKNLGFSNFYPANRDGEQRGLIYSLIYNSIRYLEKNNLNISFTAVSDNIINKPSVAKKPIKEIEISYPDKLGTYEIGTTVSYDNSIYTCKIVSWCNQSGFTPGSEYSKFVWQKTL
ncbi:chitin-binding protein [Pseudofrancisella aestuarii]|uniref:Chitin-binding protein n=1 Tax=Pseudofrancisella aestuarii TaxID=2670347 RepID=A0ABV9TD82_9GAMM|nr:chitin-binding protein [Pseudofrancisella aestuarii]